MKKMQCESCGSTNIVKIADNLFQCQFCGCKYSLEYDNNFAAEPSLKRVFLLLEEGEWEKADGLCEQILDFDPENAMVYLGKLMAENHAHYPEELKNCGRSFERSLNYQRIIRFGDDTITNKVKAYNDFINKKQFEDLYIAGKYFIQMGRATDTMLKKEFGFSFSKSAAIVEQLEELGVIGPYMDGKRKVLVNQERFEEIYKGLK